MGSANTQATRSTLQSVDTTLSENITATQNYIPVASTTNFSTSVVAEIESTNEVVSFGTITENLFLYSQDFRQTSYWQYNNSNTETTLYTAPDGTRCSCTQNLEFDHIYPHALGGESIEENLRLLCRSHNQMMAERVLGKEFVRLKRE